MLHFGKRTYFASRILSLFFLLQMLVIFPARVEGRMINLGGSLDFSYGHIRSHQNERRDETTFIQQRYNLHNFGEIFDPRIGTFLINGTFLTQNSKTNRSGINQDFEFKDYSFALNLIPYISPFSIYYQRVNRANDIAVPDPVIVGKQNPLTVKDRVTTIGGNWSLSVPRLPRVSLSYNQSKLESIDDSRRLPNTLSRFFNLESSGRVRETTVVARYQFNTTDVARLGGVVQKVTGNAFNLSTASRLSSKLFLNTYSRIANRGGGNATGVTFAQERGLGASVFYTPSVLWDTHARIDYSETPGGANATDLKRITAFWSGSYRPANELDMVMSARYFQFDVADARTTSPYLDYHINYRPFFGFSTGYGSSIGNTTTRGSGSEINTLFHRHRAFVNYTRSLEILRFTSSYAASYGVSDTKQKGPGRPASERSTDLMNTLSVGVENTRIRIVHVALAYTFNHVERRSRTVQDLEDQRSHVIQANADSSYFRGILLEDDRLQLQSTASLTQIDGFGPRGITLLLDGRGTYYFLGGGMASLGWTHQDYPGGFFLETDVFSEEIRWTSRYGNASITLGLRGSQTRGPDGRSLDRDTFASTNTIAYRIGKFRFNLDHRWSTDRSSGIEYGSQSIFARASRSF